MDLKAATLQRLILCQLGDCGVHVSVLNNRHLMLAYRIPIVQFQG